MMLQAMRSALAGTRLGTIAKRVGLGRWALTLYERRVLRKGIHQLSVAGRLLSFRVRDRADITHIDWFVRNEDALMQRILGSLQRGDTVLDVGANIGVVSVLLATASRSLGVTVHAFEANPQTAERARENAALNRCSNVTVHPLALAARCGMVTLHTNSDHHGRDSTIIDTFHTDALAVPAETADAVISRLAVRPDIMKIDVEGAELNVLRGCEQTLGQGLVREVFIEVHPARLAAAGQDEGAVVSHLRGHDYRSVWRHVRDGEVYHHFRHTEARR